jgi:uncharacterized DUF497 family protein
VTDRRVLVTRLEITRVVEEKLARHGVCVPEVREVFANPRRVRRNPRRAGRVEILGRTNGGRALVVALDPASDDTVWHIVTAYDAPPHLKAMIP